MDKVEVAIFKDYSWDSFLNIILSIWRTELMSIDNSSITIGKIVFSIFIAVFGIVVSKKLTRAFSNKLMHRMNISLPVRYTIENVTYYSFVFFFLIFALKISHIPLTIFNVLGGALAIGIGFGSQNIMNNFISSLIIMFEHPIKIGDYIEIEDTYGKVEQIGMRSTTLSSIGNRHYIIPNSKLIESKVHNWTLRDYIIRTFVRVGVAYGSPVEKVEELLVTSVKSVSCVSTNKEILVIFDDFGDNSLGFEVYFYTPISDHFSLKKAQSAVRKNIDKVFKENGITIAFPQRDLHLFASKPIDVNIKK